MKTRKKSTTSISQSQRILRPRRWPTNPTKKRKSTTSLNKIFRKSRSNQHQNSRCLTTMLMRFLTSRSPKLVSLQLKKKYLTNLPRNNIRSMSKTSSRFILKSKSMTSNLKKG